MRSKNMYQSSDFNSRCSQSIENACNPLYEAVTKNLNNQLCQRHQAHYEYYYQNQLLCEACFKIQLNSDKRDLSIEQISKYQYYHHLRSILNHPLILLSKKQALIQCPNEILQLILNSYQQIFIRKSDLTMQRYLLNTLIERIKSKVNALCDTIIANFDRAQQNIVKIGEYREEMKYINKIYQQQFEELLAQRYRQGNKQELQQILSEYYHNNQNPFEKIFNNLDEVMSHLSQAPIINTEHLINLYTTITDDKLWKCDKIISSKSSTQQIENSQLMILNNEQITLQNEYLLQMTQNGLALKRDERQLGRLDVHFDSLYHLNNYRLIGVNYESIQIIDYFDRLNTSMIFNIEGCTDILSFQSDIVVISNQLLIKIDLNSKRKTVLGNNFRDLKYDNTNPSFFICEDSEGNKIRWYIKSNQPQIQF